MTDEEALSLKDGQRIEAKFAGKWCAAAVEGRLTHDWTPTRAPQLIWVRVRRVGKTRIGARYCSMNKYAGELRFPADPIPANVYADWLSEHGFEEAAACLREAFPLALGDALHA